MRLRAAITAAGLIGLAAVPSAQAHTGHDRRPGATRFDLEVQVTHPGGGGFAPSVAVDAFGNQYAAARKETAAAYDDRSATGVRTQPWGWTSADGGARWSDLSLPATAAAEQPAGSGADVATSGGDALLAYGDGTRMAVARYHATGRGKVGFVGVATLPAATGAPQLAAQGTTVLLLSGSTPGAAGATTVHASHDGGATFDGAVVLAGSGACTAAVAQRALVTCTDGAGHLLAFASSDGGRTFVRSAMGDYPAADTTADAPSAAWGRGGTAYALSLDGLQVDGSGIPRASRFTLHRSADGGRTWSTRDVGDPDFPGRYEHARLAAGSDGMLGVAAYHLDPGGRGWHILASVFPPGAHAVLEDFAAHTAVASATSVRSPGPRLGVAFGPEPRHNRLSVVWTVAGADAGTGTADTNAVRDVWFVRSQPPDLVAAPLQERTPVGPLPPCRVAGQVKRLGAWDAIRAPTFPPVSGGAPDALTAYAVDAFDPARMYATNGTTLARSLDAGCTWTQVFSLVAAPGPDGTPPAGTARIASLLIPEYRNDHRRVVVVLDDTSPQGRPHVLVSSTGDRGSFHLGDTGLPAAGHPRAARISAANPDFLYLAVSPAGGALPSGGLYASEDAGTTWVARTPAADAPPDISVLATDPGAPNAVWLVSNGRLLHSADGGRTLTAPVTAAANAAAAGAPVTAIDISHAPSTPSVITAWSGPTSSAEAKTWRSSDGGAHFAVQAARGLDGPVESAVHGSRPDILVVSTAVTQQHPADVYHLHLEDGDWDSVVPPVRPTGPFRVSVDRRAHPSYYAMTSSLLLRYAGAEIEPGAPAPLPGGALYADPGRPAPVPVLAPARTTVRMGVGSTRVVDLTVSVPARPQRVDLYLLVDTSESMKGVLDALRARLATVAMTLRSRGVDVWAGVGGYKTDQDPPKYHRYRDVGPVDADLARALGRLDASQGAGLETQLIALHQTVAGDGLPQCTRAGCLHAAVGSTCDVDPTNPLCSVPPGQQADFRDGAVRVVLHATDAGFRNPEGTPRNAAGKADLDGVAAEFARAGILQVGLVAGDPRFSDTQAAHQDLARFAAITGARAATPVDCDGNGTADLAPGSPLVCPATSAQGVGNALYSLLAGLPDPGRLDVTAAGPTVTASAVSSAIDLHTPTARTVRIAVACRQAGHSTDVVSARATGGGVSTASVDVTCESVPGPVAVAAPAVLAPLALLPALPPAPVPVTPAQPVLNPQTQVQLQTQPQPQVQFGAQEQEQLAPVMALADDAPAQAAEVRIQPMSRRQEGPPPAYLAGLVTVTAVAGAVAVRRRQVVLVRAR